MKKIIVLLIALTAIFGFASAAQAGTLDSVDIYLKYDGISQALSVEQKAPTSISDAGEERIDTATGGVSYYKEELNLPGAGGLDLVVGRKYNTANDVDIYGMSHYISVKDYRDLNNPSYAERYVFPYHLNEDCSDKTIYVVFDSFYAMLEAESDTASISVNSSYEKSAISLSGTLSTYKWEIGTNPTIGLNINSTVFLYDDIAGNGVTLYRDTSLKYGLLYSTRAASPTYISGVAYERKILLGAGWEYDVPILLSLDYSVDSKYDYTYGLFYDPYMKECVSFRVRYNTSTKNYDAKCYYTYRPISSSENPGTVDKHMYTIEANYKYPDLMDYVITRNDGVEFSFYDEYLRAMTDRFGNTISFNYEKAGRIEITDTLGRNVILTPSGITVDGEEVVSYSCSYINNAAEDPHSYFDDDDKAVFTAKYKVANNNYKSVIYKHSQRGKVFTLNGFKGYTVSYTKGVIDSITLPTGAERYYEYGEVERQEYFNSNSQYDYFCTEQYDMQPDSSVQEDHIIYEYGPKSATPRTVTTFPGRNGYTITETFDKEGCVTKRVIECTDADYVTTEDYTYTFVDGNFREKSKTVSKTSSSGYVTSYKENYTYDAYTHNLKTITRDGTKIYDAEYTTYGLLEYEYNIYGSKFAGVKNVYDKNIKNISKTNYVIRSSSSTSTQESILYTYDNYGNLASVDGDGVYKEYSYEYGDYSDSSPQYSIIVKEIYPAVENITNRSASDIANANIIKTMYYDKRGNLVKVTDGEGCSTTYTYDLLGRVLTQTNPDASKRSYKYNDQKNQIELTDENGARKKNSFDTLGREIALYYLKEDGSAWAIIYYNGLDSYGRLTGQSVYKDGIADSTIQYTYYSDGSVKSELFRNRLSGTTLASNEYSYLVPADGELATKVVRKKTDGENVIITNYTNAYEFKLRDIIEDENGAYEQSYKTDDLGNITTVTDLNGNRAHYYSYDYRNRVVSDTTPTGKTTYVYDGALLASVADSDGATIKTYEYNSAGQLTGEITPVTDKIDSITEYYYDRNGSLTKTVQTTGDGSTVRTAKNLYDTRGFLIAADDGSGYYTRYKYDKTGNVTQVATGVSTTTEAIDRSKHHVTDYEYSFRGFLIAETDPMGYTKTYERDSRGSVTSETDKEGNITTYTYDGVPRVTEKKVTGTSGTESIKYTYDYLGNITKMVDNKGTTSYTYDGFGNILNETRGSTVKKYSYDKNGNRVNMDIASGAFSQSVAYTYDAKNRLTKVTDGNGYTTYTYDKNDNLTKETSYNTAKKTTVASAAYTYYTGGALKTKTNSFYSTPAANYITKYSIEYYADGNIASVDKSGTVTSYVYDNAGRLKSETINGSATSYTYDAYGNRATKTESLGKTTYTYDKNNRLITEAAPSGSVTRAYDKNGNMTKKTVGSTATSYTYDVLGRLTKAGTSSYTYDGNGIRLSKTVSGTTTNFINDGIYVVGENTGGNIVKYLYGRELITIDNNGTLGYYHTDEHGNVAHISDTSRAVVADYDFDAFGNVTADTAGYYNPMKYCGEYYDAETGLIYLRARYYDPGIGRFVSEDPAKDGLNWYVYCNNNPVAFVDFSGLKPIRLREVIESLGGTVVWDDSTRTATVTLDGETVNIKDGDMNGSEVRSDGKMYVDDMWLFTVLAKTYDLGKGWSARIERECSGANYNRKHVHVFGNGKSYSQNEDGSPHDGSKGSPTGKIKKTLKEKTGWDWDENESKWNAKVIYEMSPNVSNTYLPIVEFPVTPFVLPDVMPIPVPIF